ncbi:hypothetical protein ABZX95_39135 [Streptomyces sp. NPDC004232]|uniref:hypothetical protein n=1 Tax=Streptomyces sp. NPDC004232 TaxID=3154454 RepID=UPI001DE042BB|nr:hypothetical protein [Streptomyces sp. tea 10]
MNVPDAAAFEARPAEIVEAIDAGVAPAGAGGDGGVLVLVDAGPSAGGAACRAGVAGGHRQYSPFASRGLWRQSTIAGLSGCVAAKSVHPLPTPPSRPAQELLSVR